MTKDTKYITNLKELPPEIEEEALGKEILPEVTRQLPKKSEESVNKKDLKLEAKSDLDDDLVSGQELEKKPILSSKDIILGIVNFVSLGLLIYILFQFPKRGEELKELRTQEFLNEASTSFEFTEVENSQVKGNELQNLFLKESGLVDFVNAVEKIKGEESALKKVVFASQQFVKDRTGNFGIPVIIELTGTWEAIDRDLQKIDKLPFLFRAANISIEPSETEPGVLVFKYGVFLYVDDTLGQN